MSAPQHPSKPTRKNHCHCRNRLRSSRAPFSKQILKLRFGAGQFLRVSNTHGRNDLHLLLRHRLSGIVVMKAYESAFFMAHLSPLPGFPHGL